MPRKQKTVLIEDHTYELSSLGGVEGRELVIVFGQLLAKVAPFVASKKKLDTDALAAISGALEGIHPKQLEPLWEAFGKNAWILGKDRKSREKVHDVFDDHFSGEYFAMVWFFVESARFNFADFLAKALAQASSLPDTAPTP